MKNNLGQLLGVNIITLLLFALSVAVYILFGFIPFALMVLVALIYAVAANIWVLGQGGRSEGRRLEQWKQYFPDSYAVIERARASLETRSDAIEQVRDAAIKSAYKKARLQVEDGYRRSLEFIDTYDFINNPGDASGRLNSFAIGAKDAVDEFNEFLDDARDADGGAGDELDKNIRMLRRELAVMKESDPDRQGLLDVIDRLEKISDILHKRPDSAGGFRRLISYYLPTLETLLKKRNEMVNAGVSGSKANAARDEVSSALSSMPGVLDEMLASAYEGEAVDIIAEKGVMDDFLKQDSLKSDNI